MLVQWLASVAVLATVAAAQLSTGIYRISNRLFFRSLAAQTGTTVGTLGSSTNNDASVTWFIAPAPGANSYTIQNVKSLQYMSVDGTPARGSIVVPRDTPFVWTINTNLGSVGVGNLTFATLTSANLTLLPPGTDQSQQWDIVSIQPFPATYRVWNAATDTYLTGPASLPGTLTAAPLDSDNGLQYWSVAGTGPSNTAGAIANLKTGGFISISNGVVGTFSTVKPSGQGWLFSVVGGGDRLSNSDAPKPNILSINSQGAVVEPAGLRVRTSRRVQRALIDRTYSLDDIPIV